MPYRPEGSIWGKWDLHFHTPASYDYRDKSIPDAQIIETLRTAGIMAVAITDHHLMDVDRIKNLQALGKGRLTVFPGIELRSELGGKESVHLIGIFPEISDPDNIWTKLQGQLNLTPADVLRRGDDGVYVRFEEAAELIHELGGVVSTHVGRKTNSIEIIGNDFPYKQEFKKDLTRNHIDLFVGRPADLNTYRDIVFPDIAIQRPLIICSDNHHALQYGLKSPCWIKGDPAFTAFQQLISDPEERVFIGEVPPSLDRFEKNRTKYLKSISFAKIDGSSLDEDWFSGEVLLNPGLIAIVGRKGTGKTALAESLGLLGNTALGDYFTFLSPDKFKQPKNNKAKHFRVTLEWADGQRISKNLDDAIHPKDIEKVGYIPQHYLETICMRDSRFDRELKSVIFSHVEDAERLGSETLDELIRFRTEQTDDRLQQLRLELTEIDRQFLGLQRQSSPDNRQMLLNLSDEKKHELEAHDRRRLRCTPWNCQEATASRRARCNPQFGKAD